MSVWEKSLREHKPRKHPKNPSFSTILLDEMFRSIDDGEEEKTEKDGRKNNGKMASFEDEEMASLKRAYLMEKLMEKKIKDKVSCSSSKRTTSSLPDMDMYNNDPIFFSTTSSSSSDSSSGGLSLSDAEFYGSAKSTVSCFSASKHKPKNTKKSSSNVVPPRPRKSQNHSYYEQQSECYLFDDYHHQRNRGDEDSIKSKSRGMKIYSNFVKVKQPISPGGKFTSFLNSLFTNGNGKKTKKININDGYEEKYSINGGGSTTCSSASSFSRSCLSKSEPSRTTKFDDNLKGVVKRSVRFYPEDDSRPSGQKSVYGRPHFAEKNVAGVKTLKNVHDEKQDYLTKEKILRKNINYYDEDEIDEDYDDGFSDSSSDLFEIDHLALLGDERFCEELPVYETTHLDRNRAIASGIIC